MTDERHVTDRLDAYVDDRLDPAARAEVREHLVGCDVCREAIARIEWTRAAVRPLASVDVPAAVRERVAATLDREDATLSTSHRARWTIVAAVAALVLMAIWLYPTSTRAPAQAADMFTRYKSGALPIETTVTEPAALERRFASAALGFNARVFDLGMMGFRIVAASTTTIEGRPAALWVYQGARGAELLCVMFTGDLAQLPGTRDIRTNNGFTFHVFHERGLTEVFWQEGSVVCVLVSDQPEADVVQLAFAKAMRPNP